MESVGFGEFDERGSRHTGTAPEIVDRRKGIVRPRCDNLGRVGVGEPLYHAQAEPNGEPAIILRRLERAIPTARVDTDGTDLDAMIACIAHDLSRRVKAHRLGIEECCAKDVRMPAFQPGGGIGDEREGSGMAFGKAVAAEPFELLERLLGEFGLITVRHHAGDQLLAKLADTAGVFEGCHGPAQLVGLTGAEAGTFDRHPHGLFLEERHTERLAEHLFQLRLGIDHILLAFPSPEVGMHHITLDRTGPDDRDLDDEVVECPRLDARQHRHLRPALDLEGPERVGPPDHRIGARILGRDGGEIEIDALVLAKKIEAVLHAGQHAECQHVDLHELDDVDIVLVPLDHLPVDHRGRLDRHELIEAIAGEDETAGMLRQMARRAHQLPREFQGQAQAPVSEVEIELFGMFLADVLAPAPDLRREHLRHVFRQSKRFADVANGAFRAVADDGRTQGGMIAAIGLEYPLHDDLAPLVLEIDIDIRRFAAFLGNKALEQ
ncbi:hypothetical protein RHSP_82254 (plasmid) [Rhizobium freirei PRF 81]|uniref:Uncharacterized protein n=1 Tax=Rhizobium freirei PRF 81 TaxID=363754 RepID=N6U0G4_9HYPH|nr:hypothetical protein RHSP_82254 [Rhizobium freirei PRF 81]